MTDADHTFIELYHDEMEKSLQEIAAGAETQAWEVLPASRVIRVWKDFSKLGLVRDEKFIEEARALVLLNIVRICVNSELNGCCAGLPEDQMEQCGVTEEMLVETSYFWDPVTKMGRVSDFATRPLSALALELIRASTAEEKLVLLDRVFQVSHMQGDLAACFVEGGWYTLSDLFHQECDARGVPRQATTH